MGLGNDCAGSSTARRPAPTLKEEEEDEDIAAGGRLRGRARRGAIRDSPVARGACTAMRARQRAGTCHALRDGRRPRRRGPARGERRRRRTRDRAGRGLAARGRHRVRERSRERRPGPPLVEMAETLRLRDDRDERARHGRVAPGAARFGVAVGAAREPGAGRARQAAARARGGARRDRRRRSPTTRPHRPASGPRTGHGTPRLRPAGLRCAAPVGGQPRHHGREPARRATASARARPAACGRSSGRRGSDPASGASGCPRARRCRRDGRPRPRCRSSRRRS